MALLKLSMRRIDNGMWQAWKRKPVFMRVYGGGNMCHIDTERGVKDG